ncbi:putative ribonuclease H-like domain-containing protein, partial [Tanacetum coccineum]
LSQVEAEIRNQGVSADRDPAGIDSTSGVSAGSTSASSDPAGGVTTGRTSASSDPAGGNPAGSFKPAGKDNPTVSTSVSTDFIPVHADESTLPPGQSLGSSENTTRFPVPSDVCKDQLSSGIFTSSSYDDDFSATLTNLAPAMEVNLVPTKRDPDWVAAMQEEMQQFINQKVWTLVPLPDGKNAIGTKWILKNKRDARGIVVRNKARWMLRVPFSMEKIEEEVYKGFEDPYFPKHVYRVFKALYGLHQAPRAWYERLSAFLLQHNYRRGTIDKTLFIKKDSRDILLVQVYAEFEVLMQGEFEMSVMGEMSFFLGLQVKQLPDGIFISQDKYVKDQIER